jgi:hypothetical protein
LELQPAEKDRIDWVEMDDGTARWRKSDLVFTLEFGDEDFVAMRAMVNGFSGWKGNESRQGLALLEKFEKEV